MLDLDKSKYPDAARTENPVTSVGRVEEAKRMWNEKQIGLALSMTILKFFLWVKLREIENLSPEWRVLV